MTTAAVPLVIVVICGTCLSIKEFDDQHQADLWDKHHTHDEGYGS